MGCVTFGREIDEAASFAVLDHAFEQGITLFDTAAAYADGASEQVLGNWLSSRKLYDKIVLASKVTTPLTAKHVVESAEASLKRLRTETIDLFQLHTWDDDVPLDETLAALTQLQQAGKVRFIGCSNFSAWQLAKALLATHESGFARIESVQPPYNLVQREIEPDLLPLCLDQQVGVMSYSPLGAGFLTGKYHRGGPVPKGTRFDVIPGHQPIYFTEEGWRIVEGLRTLAESSGQAMIPLALSWVANRPGVTSVLVGGRTPEHIDQAISARQAPLSDDLLEAIERLLSSGT
jgi:aryl-alcohol dehydrogenase-like predicted oxidoreductase